MNKNEIKKIKDMNKKVEEIERITKELRDSGKDIPFIKKNAVCILSFTHVLRFALSDLAGMNETSYDI